jgi:excisionase family DNA binding protein
MTEQRWYSIKEVAERLNVSHDTVSRIVARGDLAAIRVSDRIVRIPAPALHRFESDAAIEPRRVVRRQVKTGIGMGVGEKIPRPQAAGR